MDYKNTIIKSLLNEESKVVYIAVLLIISFVLTITNQTRKVYALQNKYNISDSVKNQVKKNVVIMPEHKSGVILSTNLLTNVVKSTPKKVKVKKVVTKKKTKKVTYYKNQNLPQQVKEMKPQIIKAMKKNNVHEKYEEWIIALVTQESHGNGNDPFQVSEAICGSIGCISDRQESIDYGVKTFKRRINNTKKVLGFENIEFTLQSYNYGPGYLTYLKKAKAKGNNAKHAINFSKKMCGQYGTSPATAVNSNSAACYGDYNYVKHIEQYISKEVKTVNV